MAPQSSAPASLCMAVSRWNALSSTRWQANTRLAPPAISLASSSEKPIHL
jgi:hypothetical protein